MFYNSKKRQCVQKYLREHMTTNGAFVLLAQDSHTGGALETDWMIAIANGIDINCFETYYTGIIIDSDLIVASIRRDLRDGFT